MKKPILIFDFDGTIADTHHYSIEISNRICEEFGYDTIEDRDIKDLKDKSVQEIIRHLNVPLFKLPAIIARSKEEYQKNIGSLETFEGIDETLRELQQRKVKMGILSSNNIKNIHDFLNSHRIEVFDFIQTTSKIKGKHVSLKRIIEQKGYPKDRVIYVGDEIRDVLAARKLGIKVAAVSWGFNSRESLRKHQPDFLLDSAPELLNILNGSVK